MRGVQLVGKDTTSTNQWREHKDYALLFATNNYDTWAHLANPIPDAQALQAELRDRYGFETEVVVNPTRETILKELLAYTQRHFDPGDQLLIFFAGHGIYNDEFKQGYIVAKDSRMDDIVESTYVSYADLRGIIDSIPAKHILLMIDACFGGTFDRRLTEQASRGSSFYASTPLPELFSEKATHETRLYITSGGKDYVSDGQAGHHSPFVYNLLDTLDGSRAARGYLTFSDIQGGVEATKPAPSWNYWGANDPGSDFFFISKRLREALENVTSSAEGDSEAARQPNETAEPFIPATVHRPALAVLSFQNVTGDQDFHWVSTALGDGLSSEMAAGDQLRTISGEEVSRAEKDLSLPEAADYAADTLARLNKDVGCDYVLGGSYEVVGQSPKNQIHVDLRLQKTATGDTVAEASEDGTLDDLPGLMRRAGNQLRRKLGFAAPPESEIDVASAATSPHIAAMPFYAGGVEKLRAFDLLTAKDLLLRAVKAEPNFPMAHLALAQAWADLGYDSNARDEAQKAFDLSGSLSTINRKMIEANYRQMTGDWDKAIDIYRSLWTLEPDQIQFGLDLAAVQTAHGKAQDAMATLEQLRQTKHEPSDDAGIDYQEALAAESISDVKREHNAAAKAAEEALRQGSRLLAAQAYWQDCAALINLGDLKAAEAAWTHAYNTSEAVAGLMAARSDTVLANIREAQGRRAEALQLREQALAIARQVGSQKDVIGALINLAKLLSSGGQIEESIKDEDNAMDIAREIDDKDQLLDLQNNRATDYQTQGDYVNAKMMYEKSLATANEVGDQNRIAAVDENLGLLSFDLGDISAAQKYVEQGVAIAKNSGWRDEQASCIAMLGDIQLAQDNLEAARKSYQDALESFTALGDKANVATTSVSSANLELEMGNPRKAEELARQAVQEFQAENSPDDEADAHNTLAQVLAVQGKLPDAAKEINAAETLSPQDRVVAISVQVTSLRIQAAMGKSSEALAKLSRVLMDIDSMKLLRYELQAKLIQGEIQIASSPTGGRKILELVERDARSRGFNLIARKAAELSRANAATRSAGQ